MEKDETCGLILAAGRSRRFGSDKRVYPIEFPGFGMRSMLWQSIRTLSYLTPHVFIALREGDRIEALLGDGTVGELSCTVSSIHIPDPVCSIAKAESEQEGMGRSLALAAGSISSYVEIRGNLSGVWVCLADLPLIRKSTIDQLTAVFGQRSSELEMDLSEVVVVPTYSSARGHPIYFGKRWISRLVELKGDSGAKHLLKQFPEAVVEIEVDDAMIRCDIDEPRDLHHLDRLLNADITGMIS